MKKSMHNGESYAFSLAEALITLLIVCLITLASIPILTKKRRNIDKSPHGRWICTQHSQGHLVHWQKGVSTADENNPEDWSEGCTFAAPRDARNFAITVIGSGGGGASGISEMQKVFDSDMGNSFTPSESGEYTVVVIGGGGGGAAGLYYGGSDCYAAAGGAGGAGAVFVGKVRLLSNETYTLEKGKGGNYDYNSGHSGCVKGTNWADKGGQSSLRSEGSNKLSIVAPGGNGGRNIKTGGYATFCSKKCKGGDGGGASDWPTIEINGSDVTNTYKSDGESIVSQGPAGEFGGCNALGRGELKNVNYSTGANGFNVRNLGLNISAIYGGGGNGSLGNKVCANGGTSCSYEYWKNYLGKLENGKDGYVGIYKLVRKQGQGGHQSEPKQVTVPSIEGRVAITIGNSVDADTNGAQTRVEIFNKFGTRSTLIFSSGGAKGEAIVSNTNTDGENSVWTDDGGGLKGGTCVRNGKRPIYEDVIMGGSKTICEKVSCSVYLPDGENPQSLPSPYEYGDGTKNNKIGYMHNPVYDKTKVVQIGPALNQIGKGYILTKYYTLSYQALQSWPPTHIPNDLKENFVLDYNLVRDYDNFGRNVSVNGATYNKIKTPAYCFSDAMITYKLDCDQEKTVDATYVVRRVVGYTDNYDCPPGGDGRRNAYGAGGGGGYAPEVLNFHGSGGKGSPGAVIIEW